MNEKLRSFNYLHSLSIDYSIGQVEASLNHLKNLKDVKENSNLADGSTPEQAITDVQDRLSRVLTLLNKVKVCEGNLLEWDKLLQTYNS